jgi:hypothetical protein
VLQELERSLGVILPNDFKEIAAFYSGGIVGGISHNAIATSGPATNIFEETVRLRQALNLPRSLVVLAEPAESLIIMDTSASEGSPAVMWIDASDARDLAGLEGLHDPQLWRSYTDFFDFLLVREVEERA